MLIITDSKRPNCSFISSNVLNTWKWGIKKRLKSLFHITLKTMETLVPASPFVRLSEFPQSAADGLEVLSSLYPSCWTSWDVGAAPAASALASRNWHWVHCLQWKAHGWGLKVHSRDQNAVWNTNSLCALTAVFLWLPHPHQASRAALPPPAQVSTCGLSSYSHPHTPTLKDTFKTYSTHNKLKFLHVFRLMSRYQKLKLYSKSVL